MRSRFIEIKDEYVKHFERTNGKPCPQLLYFKGWVKIGGGLARTTVRIGKFEEMLEVLKKRKNFDEP